MKSLYRKIRQHLKKTRWFLYDVYRMVCVFFWRPKYNGKIFCIGFNKTGTTSCGRAFKMFGYRHSSYNKRVWMKHYANNEIVKVLQYTAKFDSLDDLPWLKEDMIPILDKVFPGSKFIYLTRDEESWKNSIYHWRFKVFGEYPDVDEWLQDFRGHKEFVLNYFADRPQDEFMTLDVSEEGAFQKLSDFLGEALRQESFPHCNKT